MGPSILTKRIYFCFWNNIIRRFIYLSIEWSKLDCSFLSFFFARPPRSIAKSQRCHMPHFTLDGFLFWAHNLDPIGRSGWAKMTCSSRCSKEPRECRANKLRCWDRISFQQSTRGAGKMIGYLRRIDCKGFSPLPIWHHNSVELSVCLKQNARSAAVGRLHALGCMALLKNIRTLKKRRNCVTICHQKKEIHT